ncbi:YegP family protein [Microbacterium sp. K2]|uniref:YegP family protein n=1 Tax=Microbacterium sp. K2 TaxID=3391827 RepID=UPI003ED9F418
MTDAQATLVAAQIAAIVASGGLIWSVASFFITGHQTKVTAARVNWQSRFEKAYALALSTDNAQARTGALLLKSLATEKWVTDEDRATAASVMRSLPAEVIPPQQTQSIVATITNKDLAASVTGTAPGLKGRYELYEDSDGLHRWRRIASNGELLALSARGYPTKNAALEALGRTRGQPL